MSTGASSSVDNLGATRVFSGDDEDAKEYKRWKVWVTNKMLTLGEKVPAKARGAYVYTLLSGKALECVEHLETTAYHIDKGEDVLFKILDARFPQRDTADELGEVMNEVFNLRANEGEALKAWVSRAGELFDRCRRKTGVSFPDEARGWLTLKRSGLTEEQQAVVLARSMGSLKREEVSRAMRSCYPEFTAPKRRSVGVSLVEEAALDLQDPPDPNDEMDFEDVEQFLADYDAEPLDEAEVFEEKDVADVLAVTWREKRKEISKMQKARRFSAATDIKKQYRVEVEEIKKKTKCHRCGRIGHWAKECRLPRNDGKGPSSGSTIKKDSGAAYVESAEFEEHFIAAVVHKPSVLDGLRNRVITKVSTTETLLVSSPGFGVLDSGCGRSIMGMDTYYEFLQLWKEKGIPPPQLIREVNNFRFGNGERETSQFVIRAPVVLAGKSGVIRTALVRGRAPLLISRLALKSLKAKLNFEKNELTLFESATTVPLQTNEAGQYVVNLLGEITDPPVEFAEVMMSTKEPTSVTETENVENIPDEPEVSQIEGEGPESLAEWSRDDSFLGTAITTGKNGPHWHLVKKRIIIDRDTKDIVREDVIDHQRKRSYYHQKLPSHVLHTRTIFQFAPQESQGIPLTECLSVRQLRQLSSQVRKFAGDGSEKSPNPRDRLMVAEVFSPPRFTPVVQDHGFRGRSYDIKNGFDFTQSSVRQQVREELQRDPPELLILCPPCTDEGGWFNLNSKTMDSSEYLRRRTQSRLFIRFCCELFEYQVSIGKQALFEHPVGSRLWTYPEVQRLCAKFHLLRCHMCRYGLRIPDSENLIRKGTRLLVSHESMKTLARECPGKQDPHHRCHDVIAGSHPQIGQVSTYAGQYTPAFVDAVLETVESFHQNKELLVVNDDTWNQEVENEVLATKEALHSSSDDEIYQALSRLHKNLGHPQNHDLVRILKHGNASERAIQMARTFTCDFCKSRRQPQVPMPARSCRPSNFNQQVGLDVKYLPGWKPNQKIKALNMVDQASCFQQVIPFYETEHSALLRRLYSQHWVSWAGPPQEVVLDPAQTNMGDPMQAPLEFEGTTVRQIAAEAHWQLGRTENHGGWFAKVLQKIIAEHSPTTKEAWEECVRHAHVKNTMIQSYGFTPHQFVFGVNPTIPGDLLNEPLHVIPATAGLTEEAVSKTQAIRRTARMAVLQLQDDTSMRRALSARPRRVELFQAGDLVAYWRQQKYQAGQVQQGGRWHGTAIVIGYVGRNLIIAHRKQIFRCAPEQVRSATTEERALIESPQAELLGIRGLMEGGTFKSHQFTDLVPSHYPTQDLSVPASSDPHNEIVKSKPQEEMSPLDKAIPADTRDGGDAEQSAPIGDQQGTPPHVMESQSESVKPVADNPDSSTEDKSSTTELNPNRKENAYGPVRRRIWGKGGEIALHRPGPMRADDFAEIMREMVPHLIEQATSQGSTEATSSSQHGSLKREHAEISSEVEPPTTRARVQEQSDEILTVQDTCHEVLCVQDWNDICACWDQHQDVDVLIANYLQKKSSKELPHSRNPPLLQELIDDSKYTEWQTLSSKSAVKLHHGREASRIREQHVDRFIGSRYVITRKPKEEGTSVNPDDSSTFTVKSRWCLQGHLDPDLNEKVEEGLLQSPTLSQLGRNLVMQLISSHGWTLQLGDIKGAFLEAGELNPRYRPLYAEQPAGGIPGVPHTSVIEVVGNVYGQNDAPVAWYKTFDHEATTIGWTRSRFDPCLYHLRNSSGQLIGIMGVHVDDTAVGGTGPQFENAIARMRKRFPYRKWRVGEGEFCGAFYSQKQNGEIHMSMKTFAENIKPANIGRGVANQQPLTEAQVRVLRAINGSLNWLASQSRPDLAVQTSLSQQAFPNPCIRNLRDANNAVKRARQHKDLKIIFHAISPKDLTLCCHSDAAWANIGEHTQAGYIIAFVHKSMNSGVESPWVPVVWKSYRLPRAVSSTLGGESQAMSTATGTVEWLSLMLAEALDGPFEPRKSREVMSARPPILATDCKSLFDHLVSPSSPTSIEDRRTSIDVVIIRESLKALQGHIRWLPTDRMIADGLTKDKIDPADLLRSCIRAGKYQISPEATVLARQAAERELRASRKGEKQPD